MRIIKILICLVTLAFTGNTSATLIGTGDGGLWDLDTNNNSVTFIGSSGVMFDIAMNPLTGKLYGVTGGSDLYEISTSDASTTFIGNTGFGLNGLTFASDGTLYGTGSNSLYSVDIGNGITTLIGSGGYSSAGDIAFDGSGTLFLTSNSGSSNSLWTLDTSDGSGTLLGDIGFNNVYGLNFFEGTLFGFTSAGDTISLDRTSGAGVFVATNTLAAYGADGVGGVQIVREPVPEPATLGLFSALLLMLGLRKRSV
ncbi:PEP-CTERM sorting domain-containing protein [Thalassotalea agarivorans]|uniref:PEP-CTERM protein-sorting domain-containing protein n=1 Tax=Thalassotalea agarivorans TaxID=349064 RepID=A0A1I0BHW5_THASX|nr:PEP-CTERM sorting domain-containing protein [Thalassotalea agarivorans]SET06477.1 PEP-CTERM protein-sorting domain-containing protein [Thalassotalea agarivorans]